MEKDQSRASSKIVEFRIGAITLAFREFFYGFNRLKRVAGTITSKQEVVLFYQNAIYKMVAEYFLLKDAFVYKTLDEVGLSQLKMPFEELFEKSVGGTTFGEVINRLRNKALVHEGYSSIKIDTIFQEANMYSSTGHEELALCLVALYREIRALNKRLKKLLPKKAGY